MSCECMMVILPFPSADIRRMISLEEATSPRHLRLYKDGSWRSRERKFVFIQATELFHCLPRSGPTMCKMTMCKTSLSALKALGGNDGWWWWPSGLWYSLLPHNRPRREIGSGGAQLGLPSICRSRSWSDPKGDLFCQ